MRLRGLGSILWASVASVAAAACGLDTSGLGPAGGWGGEGGASSGSGSGSSGGSSGGGSGSSSGSGSGSGSSSGSASSSGSSSGGDGGTTPECVSGWTLVVAGWGSNAPMCPAGYTPAYQGVQASAGAGACSCPSSLCTITQQPSCTTGNVTLRYGGGNNCNMTYAIPGQGCQGIANFGANQQLSPLPMTGGQCTGQTKVDPGMLMQTKFQTCTVPDSSYANECAGMGVPPMFQACLFAPGDVPCPTGPFSKRTVIGDSAALYCSPCTSCTVSGMCMNPMLETYSDQACGTMIQTIPANGMCNPANQSGSVRSMQYAATLGNVTCSASGTIESVQLNNPQTLCCR